MRLNKLTKILVFLGSCIVCIFSCNLIRASVNSVSNGIVDFNNVNCSSIECFSIPWQEWSSPVAESDLVHKKFTYKVTVQIDSAMYFMKLRKKLKLMELKENNVNDNLDLRLAFIFYDNQHQVMKMVFAKNHPIILLNGKAYKFNAEILKTLMPILPFAAYEDLNQFMLNNWEYSR